MMGLALYGLPEASNAHAVLTVLLARAMQALLTPNRLTKEMSQACLVVLGSSGKRFIMENAP